MDSIEKILICIDYSIHSTKAAKKGILLAKKLNAEISLIHVVDDRAMVYEDEYKRQERIEKMKLESKKLLNKTLSTFSCAAITYLEEGNPSETIIEKAKSSATGLIVLGSHGASRSKKTLMGSIAKEVLRDSEIPVLVVHNHSNELVKT